MPGLFALWQPRYAERGIATFPVNGKHPAVRNYLRMGLPASRALVDRFGDARGLGLACRANGLTILDVDSPDDRILEDAFNTFGHTPFIVRSGSGHFQGWYRHNGERRRIRPDPTKPVDILGDGFVVVPPSLGKLGNYEIIEGSLDDLRQLPALVGSGAARAGHQGARKLWSGRKIEQGRRNGELWRACMGAAHSCVDISRLMDFAVRINGSEMSPPLPDDEVVQLVAGVWKKTQSGENWIGQGKRVVLRFTEVDELLPEYPDAFVLLAMLKRRHSPTDQFFVANAMAGSAGFSLRRFVAARAHLERLGVLEMLRAPSARVGPALYRFKSDRN